MKRQAAVPTPAPSPSTANGKIWAVVAVAISSLLGWGIDLSLGPALRKMLLTSGLDDHSAQAGTVLLQLVFVACVVALALWRTMPGSPRDVLVGLASMASVVPYLLIEKITAMVAALEVGLRGFGSDIPEGLVRLLLLSTASTATGAIWSWWLIPVLDRFRRNARG